MRFNKKNERPFHEQRGYWEPILAKYEKAGKKIRP